MKKTIISALVGGALFVFSYNLLDLPIWFGLGAAVLGFGAMLLICSGGKSRAVSYRFDDGGTDAEIVRGCADYLRQIGRISREIKAPGVKNSVGSIIRTGGKILTAVKKNPEKIRQIRKFMQYYLPVIHKILLRYEEIEEQGLTSEESRQFMQNTEQMMQKSQVAFENKLNQLYAGEVIDTDAEIQVLDGMLRRDGLLDDGLSRSANEKGNEAVR